MRASAWGNKHPGTTGRIGLLYDHFVELNGYDEDMQPYVCEDTDLMRRVQKFGTVDYCSFATNGRSVANEREKCKESQGYGGKKAREVKWSDAHLDASLANVSEEMRRKGWKIVGLETTRNPQV